MAATAIPMINLMTSKTTKMWMTKVNQTRLQRRMSQALMNPPSKLKTITHQKAKHHQPLNKKAWTAFYVIDVEQKKPDGRPGITFSNVKHMFYEATCKCGHHKDRTSWHLKMGGLRPK